MRGIVKIAAVAVAITAPVALLSPVAQADLVEVQHANCGHNPPENRDPSELVIINSRVNVRNGSSTSCAINGTTQPGDRLDYYCFTQGNDGFTWTFLVDVTRGFRGWSRDNLLPHKGSNYGCGF
ncbi:hypothetical protein UK23_32765 [Lentzea aerocolonigenes]|uniref:SH3b domain-containing protein n=1 Tax=Lentzea aerocolonigenes TaxID=68170 RepID=A0A0F0GJN7_LENAE|nr:hypothetical protein [Lentzea aerocolonigenes]KJK43560.1 hypothetical protein UK23_32765 [Lentzea aerocolonigenes]